MEHPLVCLRSALSRLPADPTRPQQEAELPGTDAPRHHFLVWDGPRRRVDYTRICVILARITAGALPVTSPPAT